MSKRKVKRKTKGTSKNSSTSAKTASGRVDIALDDLKKIVEKTKSALNEEEVEKLDAAIDTLAVITNELELKGATIRKLRKMLFGPSGEKTKDVFPDKDDNQDSTCAEKDKNANDKNDDNNASSNEKENGKDKEKKKGHGRNGAKDYDGAEKKTFNHESLKAKDNCPECLKGKLYIQKTPHTIVKLTGMAPLKATVYEMERLRCNLCGKIFTAKAPDGLGKEKYDNSALAMIALLKYGSGMPFSRLERLEKYLGIPLSSSTQWELAYQLAIKIAPIYTELIKQAAAGDVLHNDDTTAKILNLEHPLRRGKNGKARTGVYTSGILSTKDKRQIALFFTGNKHAGENLEHVLSLRSKELCVPIQMCDGISANTSGDFETILANCNVHARRKFTDIADDFVKETKHILEVFKEVYINDDETKKLEMSDDERLEYHVANSKPLLDDLKEWFELQFKEKNIEENSSLGIAVNYMTGRWELLTKFLKVPGCPLDNNSCERIIKKAILHRKNSLFFRSKNGAYVSDLFMSIIHTCELEEVNPLEYLVALSENTDQIAESPENWMPWNYKQALEN